MGSTTKKSVVSMMAALGKDTRVIGRDNRLIWKLEGDLPRFKRVTSNHPIIMGRKTFESLPRALPNRTNIVITRSDVNFSGAITVNSIDEALKQAAGSEGGEEIFIIGGGEIYKQALPLADKLYLTLVDSDEPGDTFFPEYKQQFTKILSYDTHLDHNPPFAYIELVR